MDSQWGVAGHTQHHVKGCGRFRTRASLTSREATLPTGAVVLKLDSASETPGGLSQHSLLGPPPGAPILKSLGWGPRMCISKKLPGAAASVEVGTSFENQERSVGGCKKPPNLQLHS